MNAESYAALRSRVGLLDQSDRRIVRLHGPRALRILNGLITQDTAALATGTAVYAFVLTPKGRPLAEMRVLPGPEGADTDVWLDVPAACVPELMEHLERSVPPIFARFEPLDVRRYALIGPRVSSLFDPVRFPAHELGVTELGSDPAAPQRLVRREAIEGEGADVYVSGTAADARWADLVERVESAGGRVVSPESYDILRVETGLPVYGAEITTERLPQETGQTTRAVSFHKGCYTGQEVVARLHYRGHVNRHLRGLHATDAPETEWAAAGGVALLHDGRAVGEITSPVLSPTLGPIALAYVRREVEPGRTVRTDSGSPVEATVIELPFTFR